MEEQNVIDRIEVYRNDPNAWRWIIDQGPDEKFGDWNRAVAEHFERQLLPRLRSSGEDLIEFFPGQFLWGEDRTYRSGITTDRVYRVQHGTFGTGYLSLTTKSIYVVSFAKVTRKYPLKEDTGFLGGLLLGVMGERDERKPFQKDGFWEIPSKSVTDAQIIEPEGSVECVKLTTNATSWSLYVGRDDLRFALAAINMARFGQLDAPNAKVGAQQVVTNEHMARLQQLKELLDTNLITQAEYIAKKQEVLSSL